MLHRVIQKGDIHVIHNWEAADTAARNALAVTADDKGKLCWQLDNNVFYFLVNNIGPVWAASLGVPGAQGNPGQGVPVGGATGQVLAKIDGANYNTQWITPASGGGGSSREFLTAARTYYVRTDGSNANNGLTDSAGGAFLTIQKAVDMVATLDMDKWQVTIQVRDGTYTDPVVLTKCYGAFLPIIQGNLAAPSNVHINVSAASTSAISADSTSALGQDTSGVAWYVKFMKLTATFACLRASGVGNLIAHSDINFGVAPVHQYAYRYGIIEARGQSFISGGASSYSAGALEGGQIVFNSLGNGNVTFLASVSITVFAYTFAGGVVNGYGAIFVMGAFVSTGSRYSSNTGGNIITQIGSTTFFPGTTAGTLTRGSYW